MKFIRTARGNVRVEEESGKIIKILRNTSTVLEDKANDDVLIIADHPDEQRNHAGFAFNITQVTLPTFTDRDDLMTQLSEDFFFLVKEPYPSVTNFAGLPDPTTNLGVIFLVETATGIWLINRKPAGLYRSDGVNWLHMSAFPDAFSDANHRIFNDIDNSKKLQDDVSAISTATTRQAIWPDKDVKLAYITPAKQLLAIGPQNGNILDHKSTLIIANGAEEFTFKVPAEFDSLVSLVIENIPVSTYVSQAIDISSVYGAIGEPINEHVEADTITESGTANIRESLDLSSIVSSIAAGDTVGITVDHQAIGTSIHYLQIVMIYNYI